MPIWFSTRRAVAFSSALCAVKLRPKTPATLVGERRTSMNPSGFGPVQRGPTSRNLPPGVFDAEPS